MVICLLLATGVWGQNAPLTLQVSNETAPAGGWAQIKISLAKPQPVASGSIVMDLDPTVFGNIADVAVFSANGDAYGYALVSGQHLDATFSCGPGRIIGSGASFGPSSQGLGSVRNLPILVITVPVLASAPEGQTTTLTANIKNPYDYRPWKDPDGNLFDVSVIPGSVNVAGSPSVENVTPGGGIMPAGTVLHINGTGFTPATRVQADALSISDAYFAGPEEMLVTLSAPSELTGKRFVLKNPDESEFEFFSFLSYKPDQSTRFLGGAAGDGLQLLFPAQAWSAPLQVNLAQTNIPRTNYIAIQKPNLEPVDVLGQTIPGGGLRTMVFPWQLYSVLSINSSRPIRVLDLFYQPTSPSYAFSPVYPSPPIVIPQTQVTANPASLSWQWQIGSPAPPSRTLALTTNPRGPPLTPATVSGGSWLSVVFSQDFSSLIATVNPSGLTAGSYQATIIVAGASGFGYPVPSYFYSGPPLTIPVSLTVTQIQTPLLTATPALLNFSAVYRGPAPPALTVTISGSGGPGKFAAVVDQPWVSVSPSSGTIPAKLAVSVDPASFLPCVGCLAGNIVITGPENDVIVPVRLDVSGIYAQPESLTFSSKSGSLPQTQTVNLRTQYEQCNLPFSFSTSVSTESGGAWLSSKLGPVFDLMVSVDPGRLPAGQYTGMVTFTDACARSVRIPVTLVVWDTPPPLIVTPSSLTLLSPMGSITESVPAQMLTVQSAGVPLPLSIVGGLPLVYPSATSLLTPASVSVSIRALPDYSTPGEYHGSFQITTPGTTITVPVTVLVTPIVPPVIGSVVNAASQIQGAVAPGEIVTIYGFAAGPPNTLGFTLDPAGTVATNYNGTQVLFEGKPAPLLYSSPSRTTLVVPYEVADRQSTNVEIAYNGARSAAWGVPVAPSAPAIFTLDGSGVGQAAALNQDNSSNGPSNPAARGTVIQVYATGAGQTSPPGATGSLVGTSAKIPALPVRVTIDGVEAPMEFVGSAPDSVDGLLQLNVVLPQTITPGLAVPISMTVGGVPSQDGVTIAVN